MDDLDAHLKATIQEPTATKEGIQSMEEPKCYLKWPMLPLTLFFKYIYIYILSRWLSNKSFPFDVHFPFEIVVLAVGVK